MKNKNRGQVLVIFAVSLIALLLFLGLAIDTGQVYVTYGQLKRAVDAASVASANNFKRGKSLDQMKAAALEVLQVHNVDISNTNLVVKVCDANNDGYRDAALATDTPKFNTMCPITDPSVTANSFAASPRKLVYVQASQKVPFYFLTLLGIHNITLTTDAVAEAATIDLVIVIDTSGSMASECQTYTLGTCTAFKSPGYTAASLNDYDPNASGHCNVVDADPTNYPGAGSCYPLFKAKTAAIALTRTLYPGYDNVGIVSFDTSAHNLSGGLVNTINQSAIETQLRNIKVHHDAPYSRLWPTWRNGYGKVNPINPEDRDGDGSDTDDPVKVGYTCVLTSTPVTDGGRWDVSHDTFGWGGVPCDDNTKLDAFDWDGDTTYTQADTDGISAFVTGSSNVDHKEALTSTCTGCGIRVASDILQNQGRAGSIWVIVFLTDGVANMTDDNTSSGGIVPAAFTNQFCVGKVQAQGFANSGFWSTFCTKLASQPRYCIESDTTKCPPFSTVPANFPLTPSTSPNFSADDYARKMVDLAALSVNKNKLNPTDSRYNANENWDSVNQKMTSNEIAIYSIGLGDVSSGESLMRYMAAVGDDGDRVTDPCYTNNLWRNDSTQGYSLNTPLAAHQKCGNYYYAPTGNALLPIFENIASRIYTKISQ
jgi:hypothetical protein